VSVPDNDPTIALVADGNFAPKAVLFQRPAGVNEGTPRGQRRVVQLQYIFRTLELRNNVDLSKFKAILPKPPKPAFGSKSIFLVRKKRYAVVIGFVLKYIKSIQAS